MGYCAMHAVWGWSLCIRKHPPQVLLWVLFQGSVSVTCPPDPGGGAMPHGRAYRRSARLSPSQAVMWGPPWGAGVASPAERREGRRLRTPQSPGAQPAGSPEKVLEAGRTTALSGPALGPHPGRRGPGQPTKCAVEGQQGQAWGPDLAMHTTHEEAGSSSRAFP